MIGHELTRNRRQAILRRAAEIYRNGEASWVKGQWIILGGPLISDRLPRLNSSARMGAVRSFLKGKRPDQKCNVCLEGALMLALAEDTSIPQEVEAFMLLPQLAKDVQVVSFAGFDESFRARAEGTSGDLVSLNDTVISYYGGTNEESKRMTAAKVLDLAADSLRGAPHD